MATMLEALKKAKLVAVGDAERLEQQHRTQLASEERNSTNLSAGAATRDANALAKQGKFLNTAAHETKQPGSRVGTKQYFDRFK